MSGASCKSIRGTKGNNDSNNISRTYNLTSMSREDNDKVRINKNSYSSGDARPDPGLRHMN